MNHVFKPKNYSEAWDYFRKIPFYKFSDFLKKKELVFNKGEIISVEKYSTGSLFYLIYYKTNYFDGYFSYGGNIDEQVFGDIQIEEKGEYKSSVFIKELLSYCFSLQSPALWAILFGFIFGVICIEYKGYIFPGYLKPEFYASTYCGVKCVKLASLAWSALLLLIGTTLGELIIGLVFFFYISTKIRNAQKYDFVRTSSFILILVNLSIGVMVVRKSIEQDNFKKAVVIFRLAYTPEYFKNPINRKIASETLGAEVKENKLK